MDRKLLEHWYIHDKKSVHDIAHAFNCSDGKINYWLEKYFIPKRSISDAIYTKHNPHGDPFSSRKLQLNNGSFLFGLGLGLYWGEGTKKNLGQVRLGNTDPYLVRVFLFFLRKFYRIDNSRLHFAIQIFTDMDQKRRRNFGKSFSVWMLNNFIKP